MLNFPLISVVATGLFVHLSPLVQIEALRSKQAAPNTTVCLQRVGELDKCLPKLILYGDRDFDAPKSEEQLDQHCRLLDDNVKCVSSYSRECLPAFARNIYSVITRRMKTQFGKRCKTKDGRRDFLNLMACVDPLHMEPAHMCMDAFIAHLEQIGAGSQHQQIELTCCTFQLFQDCIFTASEKMNCPHRKVTAEQAIGYVRSIINSMGGDMMDLMCGRFDKISTCEAGYPKQMGKFKQIATKVKEGEMRPKSSSPLKPMLKLFINDQDE